MTLAVTESKGLLGPTREGWPHRHAQSRDSLILTDHRFSRLPEDKMESCIPTYERLRSRLCEALALVLSLQSCGSTVTSHETIALNLANEVAFVYSLNSDPENERRGVSLAEVHNASTTTIAVNGIYDFRSLQIGIPAPADAEDVQAFIRARFELVGATPDADPLVHDMILKTHLFNTDGTHGLWFEDPSTTATLLDHWVLDIRPYPGEVFPKPELFIDGVQYGYGHWVWFQVPDDGGAWSIPEISAPKPPRWQLKELRFQYFFTKQGAVINNKSGFETASITVKVVH